jgi:hypothetical protein
MTTQENVKLDDVHQQCSLSNDFIIKSCLNRKCLDNITLVIVSFENFERIFNLSYPVLHTYEDQPVSKKLLGNADTINSNRNNINSGSSTIKRQNFEKINKIRAESLKTNANMNVPASSKGLRPKINNIEENNNNYNNNNNNNIKDIQNKNGFMKLMTPLNSAKER